MMTPTAICDGRPKPGFEECFCREIRARLVPQWTQFPQASIIRLLKVKAADEDALPIAMIQQIDYPSMAALAAAAASPIRGQTRAITLEIMEMFNGRCYHVMSEGSFIGQAQPEDA